MSFLNDSPWYIELILSTVAILLFFIMRNYGSRFAYSHAVKHGIDKGRVRYTLKVINFGWGLAFLVALGLIWDIQFQHISFWLASFATVAGVALFASWSILSNITASVILFFYHPMRIGERVKIMDGDNSVAGRIRDINMFSITFLTDDNRVIVYPNNLAIQKPIQLLKNESPEKAEQADENVIALEEASVGNKSEKSPKSVTS